MNKLISIKPADRAMCQFCKDVSKAYFVLDLRPNEKPTFYNSYYDDEDPIPTLYYCIEHFENLIDELKGELATLKLKREREAK